jgi:hypothetical protein
MRTGAVKREGRVLLFRDSQSVPGVCRPFIYHLHSVRGCRIPRVLHVELA